MMSPPPPLQPPQPQAHLEPVDIPGSKLCPGHPRITAPFSCLFSHLFTHLDFYLLFFNGQHRGEKTLSAEGVKLQSLFRGLLLQLLGKMTVNPNAELRNVATKLDSPPRSPMLLHPQRTAGSLGHESMRAGRGAPYCDFPSLELFYLFISSPTHVSPAASSLFWLGLPFPYDKSRAHTQ